MYMYINTTPSLSSSHRARRHHHLLLIVSWWHLPCALCCCGDGGGHPGSHCCPPHRAGWWWWWGCPCHHAPRLTRPPCHHPCHRLIVVDVLPWHWPWVSRCRHHHVDAGKGVVVGLPSLLLSLSSCPSSLPPLSLLPSSFWWWWWHVVEG